jgi:hypothetical protein
MEYYYDFVYNVKGESIRCSLSAPDGEQDIDPATISNDDFESIKKERIEVVDLMFQHDSHDVRLALAAEKKVTLPHDFDKKKYEMLRKKVCLLHQFRCLNFVLDLFYFFPCFYFSVYFLNLETNYFRDGRQGRKWRKMEN